MMMTTMPGSTFRFRTPSFLRGMAGVLDLTGGRSPYLGRPGQSGAERDAEALANDWVMVGGDLSNALQRVGGSVRAANGHGAAAR